jgi:hypothetical protein
MKWYKHDSNAHVDAKLERVMMKYGLEGYGLYWYLLELIAMNVDQHNLTFELEHDAEIIAKRTGLHYEVIQEMMTYMVDLGLFENDRGVITCLKLATRTDEYTSKVLRTVSGQSPDKVPPNRIEQNRTEQNRTEQNRVEKPLVPSGPSTKVRLDTGFDRFWSVYPKKRKKKLALDIWKRKKLHSMADGLIDDVTLRVANDERWLSGYIPDPTTYLNQERWTDELTDSQGRKLTYAERMKKATT